MSKLPGSISINDWRRSLRQRYPPPNGLALLIGCKNSCNIDHKPLPGVEKDLVTLRETFSDLAFTTLCLFDPTASQVKELISTASNLLINGLLQPESWKRVVVTFSGHGDQTFLYTKDQKITLEEDIFEPLITSRDPSMVGIAKLFFIDACRGGTLDYGIDLSNLRCRGEDLVARGERIPTRGNYLVAYSTLLEMPAFELRKGGGCWIQFLAAGLREPSKIDSSIQDLLVDVNHALIRFLNDMNYNLQQPEVKHTLHEKIYLQKEAQEIFLRASLQQQQQIQSQSPHQYSLPPDQHLQQSDQYLQPYHLATSAHVSQQQQWGPYSSTPTHFPPQWSQSCATPGSYANVQHVEQDTLWDSGSSPSPNSSLSPWPSTSSQSQWSLSSASSGFSKTGSSPLNFSLSASPGSSASPGPSSSPGPLANKSLNTPQNQTLGHARVCSNTTSPSSAAASPPLMSSSSCSSLPDGTRHNGVNNRGDSLPTGSNPNAGKYRSMLNTYNQKNMIRDIQWQEEAASGGGFCACVTAREVSSGRTITGRCRKNTLSKREAQEIAAKSLIDQIKQPVEKAVNKSSKSLLKEYYDKEKKEVKYTKQEVPNGFKCTVFCAGIGYVKGDVKPTVKEAENSAASKALSRLNKK